MYGDIGVSASKGRSDSGPVLVQLVAGSPFPLLYHHESSGFQSEGTLSLLSSPPRFALSLYPSSGSAEEEHPATPVQLPLQVCCIPSLQ